MRSAALFTRQLLHSVVGACFVSLTALAQQQNVLPEAPRKPATVPAPASLFPFHPIAAWEGQRFIFLSCPLASRNASMDEFSGKHLRRDYLGRIAKVVQVSDFSGRQHVEFEMEDNGEKLRARTLAHKESLEGLLLVEDLERAQKEWMGKTLWSRQMRLATYDEASDTLGSWPTKRYCALKVIEITPGWDAEKPLRFVLETADGKRGFIDVNLSGTNVPPPLRLLSGFEENFLTDDPRAQYKWSASTWAAIESNRILTGMTMEQVKMSWGEATQTARTATGEQWTYAAGVLSFDTKGVLVNWR